MLGRRRVGVDDADARARLERRDEIVEQGVRLGDLVIHVHHDCNVERISWQSRIVWLTEADYNVLQSEIAYPTAQATQIFGYDILCDDAAVGTDDRGQPHNVIAAARSDVRDGHPGFNTEQTHKLGWFAGIVTLLFFVPDWADDVRDRASGFGKATAGVPDPAMKSCAETDIVNAAAKTATTVIRIRSPTQRLRASKFARERPLMESIGSNLTEGAAGAAL
jgi:hypothetical protein